MGGYSEGRLGAGPVGRLMEASVLVGNSLEVTARGGRGEERREKEALEKTNPNSS